MSNEPNGKEPEQDDILAEHPEFNEPILLEDDETVPPRPEEEAADAARS